MSDTETLPINRVLYNKIIHRETCRTCALEASSRPLIWINS